jgi:LemA protein
MKNPTAFALPWLARHALVKLAFVLGLVGLFFVPGCQNYDQLVEKDQICEQKWADYEAQLQRRYDLVPNLVNTVKASAKHEADTLAKVTEARASATGIKLSGEDFSNPEKMAAFQKAQDQLKGSLSRLLVANEAYPELKGNQAFRDLQVQLEGTENRILRSREEYNNAVRVYNTELKKIKGQVVNKATGKPFKERVYFTASTEAQAAPKVTF